MTGITEEFTLPGTKGMKLRVTAQEEYDMASNTSALTVTAAVMAEHTAGHIYYLDGSVEIGGTCVQTMEAATGSHFVYVQDIGSPWVIREGGTDTQARWTKTGISHDPDGGGSVRVAVHVTGWEGNGGGASGWTVTGAREVTLTRIPRASTFGATDADVGAVSMVAINRFSDRFTHTLAFRLGSITGYVYPGGVSQYPVYFYETVVAFPVPEAFYTQMVSSKSASCALTLCTFDEGMQVGEGQSGEITVTASQSKCRPTVSCSAVDVNETTLALTGNRNAIVRFASTARCTISAQANNSATIQKKTVNNQTIPEEYLDIPKVENARFIFSATDSRGYSTSVTVQKAMVPYVHLTANVAAKRTDPSSGSAEVTVSGEYYAGSFGAKSNTLQVRCRVGEGAWMEMTPSVSGNGYTASARMTGLDYKTAYPITLEVRDALESLTKEAVIGKGIPVFDWGEADVCFHVPVRFLAGFRDETGG